MYTSVNLFKKSEQASGTASKILSSRIEEPDDNTSMPKADE